MEKFFDFIKANLFPQDSTHEMKEDMMSYLVNKWQDDYNQHHMNKEVVIKNKINALNITLPNAKVGEQYNQIIKISDDDIAEYWVEGLENSGFTLTLENIQEEEQPEVTEEVTPIDGTPEEAPATQPIEVEAQPAMPVIGTKERGIVISGIPTEAGDYDVVIKYKYKGWFNGCSILDRLIRFSINPDPRSLWKDIPTDENIKFFKPDYASNYVTVLENAAGPQKDIVAASKRGRSHAHEGKPRDDEFQMYHNDANGWYVIAVADGAGSAKYSRKGSEIACKTALDLCKQSLSNPEDLETAIAELHNAAEGTSNSHVSKLIYNIVGGAAYKAHRAINEAAKANEDKPRDYSTTLLLAICKKFDFGWFVASFWVGDGAMCIYDKDRQYIRLLGTPDGGEYAGQTRFLTMPEIFATPEAIMGRLKYSIEQDFTALLLMSDGVSDPFFETDANLNRIQKWNELWENIVSSVDLSDDNSESQYQLLQWLDFWSPGNHDDRTIAILY